MASTKNTKLPNFTKLPNLPNKKSQTFNPLLITNFYLLIR